MCSHTLSKMFNYSCENLNEFQLKLEDTIATMISGRIHMAFRKLAELITLFDNILLSYKKQSVYDQSLLLRDDDAIQSDAIEHVHVDNSLLLNDFLDDEEDDEEDKPPPLDSREDSSNEEEDDSILEINGNNPSQNMHLIDQK